MLEPDEVFVLSGIKKSKNQDQKPVISAYIITKNEEKNIGRALESIQWMDEIIVLDSGSTDKTVEIAKNYGAHVETEAFKGFVRQKNMAMELCRGHWLFNLDADEEVTPELRKSIHQVLNDTILPETPVLFKVCRKTMYMGRWIKHCGWYPEYRARLSRDRNAKWKGEVLHERLESNGMSDCIHGDLLHRPYANLGEHLRTIDCYSELWAKREASKGRKTGFYSLLFRPFLKFIKMYIVIAGFMDGRQGIIASIMGAWYTFMKYIRLYELSRDDK